MDKKVYAIVVTFNGMEWIDRCLCSLRDSSISVHTIVVDNCSSDNTVDYVMQNHPEVELIRSKTNLGFGKGNNIGLKRVMEDHVDYAFLLNQDAWVKKNTIEDMIKCQQKYSEYGILSPVHTKAEGNELDGKFAEYVSSSNTPGLISDFYFGEYKEVYTTRFVNAAAWLLSRECLEKVGGFSPIYPHYGEDEDFVNRCHFHGFLVGISPMCSVSHDNHFSWEEIEFNVGRNLVMNLVKLTNINKGSRSVWLLFFKKTFDEITSYLLFRKFRKCRTRLMSFWKTVMYYNKINASRKLSKEGHAFFE